MMGMDIRTTGQPAPPPVGPSVEGGAQAAGSTTAATVEGTPTATAATAANALAVTVAGRAAAPVGGLPAGAAPPLAAAAMDPDTANILVAGLMDKVTTEDMKNLMSQLKDASKRLDSVHAEKLKKFAEKAAKAVEEAKKQREQKISGDVGFGLSMAGAVLGLVGAVLLTIFTLGGGAAAIAGASIGLAATILDGADRLAKENNLMDSGINKGKQMDLTLGGLVSRLAQEIVAGDPKFAKLPPDQKEKVLNDLKMVCQIVVMVAVAAGTIACGGVSLAQVSGAAAKAGTEAAKAGTEAAKFAVQQGARIASQGAETLQVVTDLTGGVNSIVSGAYGVQMANITFDKNQIDNQRQRLESFAQVIKSEIESDQDALTQRMESLSGIYDNLAATNKNYYESQSRLTSMS